MTRESLFEKKDTKKRDAVVHYTRNSTPQQVANKTHEEHLAKLRKYSDANNFHVLREFVDKGISGTKKERKQLKAMRTFITSHDVDYIVITKLDRIMRNWIEFNDLYKELMENYW